MSLYNNGSPIVEGFISRTPNFAASLKFVQQFQNSLGFGKLDRD